MASLLRFCNCFRTLNPSVMIISKNETTTINKSFQFNRASTIIRFYNACKVGKQYFWNVRKYSLIQNIRLNFQALAWTVHFSYSPPYQNASLLVVYRIKPMPSLKSRTLLLCMNFKLLSQHAPRWTLILHDKHIRRSCRLSDITLSLFKAALNWHALPFTYFSQTAKLNFGWILSSFLPVLHRIGS